MAVGVDVVSRLGVGVPQNQFEILAEFLEAQCLRVGPWLRFEGLALHLDAAGGCFHCGFAADRGAVPEHEADAAVADVFSRVEAEFKPWSRRFEWTISPFQQPEAEGSAEAISTAESILTSWLTGHGSNCPRHRDRDHVLFLNEVVAVTGWHPMEDHLKAHFCVDAGWTDVVDEICCARAIAALTSARPELAGLLWACTTWK